ncbi:BatA domain-containing protein [Flavitalea antarctica]
MLQFLNPIWLAAGAGIIIPVIIHLWNIRKGKVLRIGSTLLMTDATQQTSSSLRPTQWLLLLLRCLMILALAMLMAGPEWQIMKQKEKNGWVLVDKKDFSFVYNHFRTPIDSLLNQGFELHAADETLERINISDSSRFIADSTTLPRPALSYWSILSRADKLLPAAYPVYFFSNDKLSDVTGNMVGRRPVVSVDLRWQMVQKDTVYPSLPVITRQLNNGAYELSALQPGDNGSFFVKTVTSGTPDKSEQVDTSTLRVSVYHNKFAEDVRYLQAAIKAISAFGSYKLVLTSVDKIEDIPASQHWLFWLSKDPPPANVTAENLFLYQPGTPVLSRSWLTTENGGVLPGAIAIFQRVAAADKEQRLIWKDGFGSPLLTLEESNENLSDLTTNERNKAQRIYRFYTRFHPAWSDLSWNPEFPKLLFPLIVNDPVKQLVPNHDQNITEPANVIPTVTRQTYKENKSAVEVLDLSYTFWLVAFLLFAAERIISFNRRNTKQINEVTNK